MLLGRNAVNGSPGSTTPTVAGGQAFSYFENKTPGYVVGTVSATDAVGVTNYRFGATGTNTSLDGNFTISPTGVITLTAAGGAPGAASNDFETGANTFSPTVQAGNAALNWSPAVAVTINVLDADEIAPTVSPGQAFSYVENQLSGVSLGTVSAADNIAVTAMEFTATGTHTSSDGFFAITDGGVVSLTVAGAASTLNDYDDAVSNVAVHAVRARDAALNWSASQNITFSVTNSVLDDPSMLIGMNVGYTNDFSAAHVFANLMRNARPWKRQDDGSDKHWPSQNQGQISGATGTMRFTSVVCVPEAGLPSQTLKFKGNGVDLIAVTGSNGDPGIGAFSTGDFNVPYTAGGFLIVHAMGNVTGTLALLLAGHEASYAGGNEFSSNFLNFHINAKTQVLRFMDGSATNSNMDRNFTDRTVLGKVNFQGDGGIQIPYEVQIDAANRLGCHLWVNISAFADTNTFTAGLASLVASTLNSPLKVYVERGNEIWNTGGVGFQRNTEILRRVGHTRFTYTSSGTTFTKTAHGYSNDQRFQSFPTKQVPSVGIDSETQLTSTPWATGAGYVTGQYIVGDFDGATGGDRYVCIANHTAGATFAGDAATKWRRVEWYNLINGRYLFIKVLTANTFELWTGAGGTGVKCAAPADVTTLMGILSDEFGVIADEAAALNTGYASTCLADWTAFDTAFGGTTRVKAILGSQSANAGSWTAGRLAVTGVAARCNHLHIAPYHNGVVWGGKVVPAAGKITPHFWNSNDGTGHCTIYTAGSTPTLTERKAGTGSGFQTRLSPMALNGLFSSNDRFWRVGADVPIADGTYKVYMDFVDADGHTWTIVNNVVVGAGQPTVDFLDTDANQQIRDLWNINNPAGGDLAAIRSHQAAIALSSNPAITIIHYEDGSHQDYYPPPGSGLDTWYRNHRKSVTYGVTLRHYKESCSATGTVLSTHYMDVSGQGPGGEDTPWRISDAYSNQTDQRYLTMAAFNGAVPKRTGLSINNMLGNTFTSAPSYPAVITTFSDPSLTYTVLPRGTVDDGNYSITGGNTLNLTATGSINFAAPATQRVWIWATDGHTDTFFAVDYVTGSAWYSPLKQVAWSKVADTNATVLDLIGGTPITGSPAATVVPDGFALGGTASYDSGYGASPMPYTSSPVFVMAGRPNGDTTSFQMVTQFGNGPSVQMYTGSSTSIQIDLGFTAFSITVANVKTAVWVWFDNANLKYYYGTGQTVLNPSGTSYPSQGAAAFPGYLRMGNSTSSWIVSGFEVAPAANQAAALAIVQGLQTEVGA